MAIGGAAGGFVAGSIIAKLLLDKSGWNQSVSGVAKDEKKLQGMSDRTAKRFRAVGTAMTVAGAAIIGSLGSMIGKASNAEETFAKFGTVFRDVFDKAETSANNLATGYGLSTLAAKDMLSATGDLLTGLGISSGAALDLSEKTQQLAVDLASFTNYAGGAEGASDALTKAMLGEREMVKSLGIVITEEMVKEQLLAEGKTGLTGLALKQAKAEATLTLAYQQSKNAIGDYERTSDSFANQQRLLKARLEDVAVTLGQQLLPIATELVNHITSVVQKIKDWTDAHPELTNMLVKAAAALGGIMLAVGPLLIALPKLIQIHQTLSPVLGKNVASMLSFKAASITTAAGVGILVAALAALAIGYMKVKEAQDKANKAAQTAADREDELFRKIKKATDAAGLSEQEFLKLRDAYHGNAAAMAMAIQRGKEGKELQEELAKVSKEHKEEIEGQKTAMDNAIPSVGNMTGKLQEQLEKITAVKEETKTWVDYLADMGIMTIKEKEEKIEELTGYLEDLHEAYENGLITLEDYLESTRRTKEKIDELSTTITTTAVPAVRNLSGVTDLAAGNMTTRLLKVPEDLGADFVPKMETVATDTKTLWEQMADGLQTKWATSFSDMLSGATSFKDGFKGILDSVKEQFFDIVGQMIAKWVTDFIGGMLSSAQGGIASVGETITGGLKAVTKGISGAATGLWMAAGAAVGTFLGGLLGGGAAGFDHHDSGNLQELRDLQRNTRDLLRIDFTNFAHIMKDHLAQIESFTGTRIPERIKTVKSVLEKIKDYMGEMVGVLKNVTSAAGGTIVEDTELVMAHGSPSNPELIIPYDEYGKVLAAPSAMFQKMLSDNSEAVIKSLTMQLEKMKAAGEDPAKIADFKRYIEEQTRKLNIERKHMTAETMRSVRPATPSVNYTPNFNISVNGTMVTDRDYTRQRLLPEILNALEQKEGRRRFERALGLAK